MYGFIISHSHVNSGLLTHVLVVAIIIFFPPRNERRNETLMIVSVTKFARPQKNQNERIWKKNCKNQNHLAYMRHTSKKYFVRRKTDSISKGKKEIGFI